jgi:ABC-type transporter Mla subunit MlaD
MLDSFLIIGRSVRDAILSIASIIKEDFAPGIVVLLLVAALIMLTFQLWYRTERQKSIVIKLQRHLKEIPQSEFALARDQVTAWLSGQKSTRELMSINEAWSEFNETLLIDKTNTVSELRNTLRPSLFFNIEDLHFGVGFHRIVPGLFVSIGLSLTFLGLIAALDSMSNKAIDQDSMKTLLKLASAKFIMSLTGLVCSIVFTIIMRRRTEDLDNGIHQLCRTIESRVTFVSLEQIAEDQLAAIIESRDFQRKLGYELVAELSRPLRDELPRAISDSIFASLDPILKDVRNQGAQSVQNVAGNLAEQLTASVGAALTQTSEQLALASDRIGGLIDRLDQSSGRMGSEMEQAVLKLAESLDGLRRSAEDNANVAGAALTQGAEQLLSAMNDTLQGIRENTSEGARAMSSAAEEISRSILAMKAELENIAGVAASEAKRHIGDVVKENTAAVDEAGVAVSDSLAKAAVEINQLVEGLAGKVGQELIRPISELADQLRMMINSIADGSSQMKRMSESVSEGAKAGSDAADKFRTASKDLVEAANPVRATAERIEGAIKGLSDNTNKSLSIMTNSTEQTARTISDALTAAKVMIGEQKNGVASVLNEISAMLIKLTDQTKRVDGLDETLGNAFSIYTTQTDNSVRALRNHVEEMSIGLGNALSVLQSILDGLQDFTPQQKRG